MMLSEFINKYGLSNNSTKLNEEDLAKIKQLLPDEIVELFRLNGLGSWMDGYLWMVNPLESNEILKNIYEPVEEPAIIFARDAFAGLFLWEADCIIYVDVRHGSFEVVGNKPSIFFNKIITDWDYYSELVRVESYVQVKEILGEVNMDECYGYEPILAAGGSEKVENLRKVKLIEHISLITQFAGPV